MSPKALLFLQQSDITAYCKDPSKYDGLRQIFIDPGLAEKAMRQGLDLKGFDYRPITVSKHFQARAASEAMTRAMAVDHTLTKIRANLFGAGVFSGWDHVTLRFFFLRGLIARYLGEACNAQFEEETIGLLRPRKPQQFYFDSYVSTDAFIAGRERWSIVGHYEEVAEWVPGAYSTCFDFPWLADQVANRSVQALVHIPTVYEHLQHYQEQILQRYPTATELPSHFWDVPITQTRRQLLNLSNLPPVWMNEVCEIYRRDATKVLDTALTDLIPQPEARNLQVNLLGDQCYLQAINYLGLLKALKGCSPAFIVSEHDTGALGPLFSVAERLGSSITVLPHSAYPTQPLPHAMNVTAIERDGFASPVRSVWGVRVSTRAIKFKPQRPMLQRGQIRTVCLLLNTLASRGISYIDLAGLAVFHRSLEQLCQSHKIKLLVRPKPGAAHIPVAAAALNVAPDLLRMNTERSLMELAEETDLCISYGELTSGVIDFFDSGSYVMHVDEEERPTDLLNSSNLSTMRTLLSIPGKEALLYISEMLNDSIQYQTRLSEQRKEFSNRLTATDCKIFTK